MDSTEKPFTAVEWCAGYGGIHLGLKRAIPNLRVIAFSEIEAFAVANLVAKMEAGLMDAAPVWPNLKTFPSAAFASKVDLLVAGYPCQPFSHAGKRQGEEDERHLWPYIADGIRAMRPRFCFFENVEGHITLGLREVIGELEELGYATTWGIFSAAEVGAPHQRKRVFILAYNITDGRQEREKSGETTGTTHSRITRSCQSQLAYSSSTGSQGLWERGGQEGWQESVGYVGSRGNVWPSRPGEPQYEWEPPRVVGDPSRDNVSRQTGRFWEAQTRRTSAEQFRSEVESEVGRNTDGTPDRLDNAELYESCDNRVDELRLLGNGVVPATAEKAWRVLFARLMAHAKG